FQGVQAVGRSDRVERRADPFFEGLVEDHHQRDQQQHRQVAEAEEPQAPAAGGIGSHQPCPPPATSMTVVGMNSLEPRSWRIAQRWISETEASSSSEATSSTTETAAAPTS